MSFLGKVFPKKEKFVLEGKNFPRSQNQMNALIVHLNGLQCGFASVFMWSDFENFLSHFEQLKVFSSVWVLSCSFKELDLEKHLSRFVHLNGFSPVSLSNLMVRSSCHTLGT